METSTVMILIVQGHLTVLCRVLKLLQMALIMMEMARSIAMIQIVRRTLAVRLEILWSAIVQMVLITMKWTNGL